MRGRNALDDGRFQCGRCVKFLPPEHTQGLTDHIAFVGVTTAVDETIHKLVQRRRKGGYHGGSCSPQPDIVQIGIAMVSRPFSIPASQMEIQAQAKVSRITVSSVQSRTRW